MHHFRAVGMGQTEKTERHQLNLIPRHDNLQTYPSIAKFFDGLPSMTNIAPSEDAVNIRSPFSENLSTYKNNEMIAPDLHSPI